MTTTYAMERPGRFGQPLAIRPMAPSRSAFASVMALLPPEAVRGEASYDFGATTVYNGTASEDVPDWAAQALDDIARIARLADDFDGQGGSAPSRATVELAFRALSIAKDCGCPVAGTGVSGDGTISLDFVSGDIVAELEAYPSGRLAAWVDRPGQETVFWGVEGRWNAIRTAVLRIRAALGIQVV